MNRLQVPDDATRKHRTGATNSIGEPIEVGKRDVNSFGGEINIIQSHTASMQELANQSMASSFGMK